MFFQIVFEKYTKPQPISWEEINVFFKLVAACQWRRLNTKLDDGSLCKIILWFMLLWQHTCLMCAVILRTTTCLWQWSWKAACQHAFGTMEKSIWENISSQGRDIYAMHTAAFLMEQQQYPFSFLSFKSTDWNFRLT